MSLRGLEPAVRALAAALLARGWRLATAESCTGGLVAAACTSVAGSSDWFERGFVTYSNEAKVESLGVDAALIAAHGAVSEEVARAMVRGALAHSRAQLALAVTGIAGPTGAVPGDDVGGHAQQLGLGRVAVGDEAALEPVRRARQVGAGGGDQAAGAAFGAGHHPAALRQRCGQALNDLGRLRVCSLRKQLIFL